MTAIVPTSSDELEAEVSERKSGVWNGGAGGENRTEREEKKILR